MSDSGLTRRRLLKGGAAVAGVAAGSGAITGFPTIWAQNIKDVTLTHVGQSFSVIPQIGAAGQQGSWLQDRHADGRLRQPS